jgi:flagellar biosynthesis/type III secretory pathway protein FliH
MVDTLSTNKKFQNYPFQQISDIITKWEMKQVPKLDFLEEAEKEKKELEESWKESVRQAKERKRERDKEDK